MDYMIICKKCNKLFTDVHGLNEHKMAQHPTNAINKTTISSQNQQLMFNYSQKQQKGGVNNNNINISKLNGGSTAAIISDNVLVHPHFRNNSNISITRIHKESNNSVKQNNSVMNRNPSSFRKASAASQNITVRRAEMKARQGEGTRVKPPFKSQTDSRMKGVQGSIKVGISARGGEVDDDTTDWQKWEPAFPKDRGDGVASNHQIVTSTTPSTQRPGGVPLITKSAAEVACSAFNYTPAQLNSSSGSAARKSVPPLYRLPTGAGGGQQGGGAKRAAPGVKVGGGTQRIAPSGGARGGQPSTLSDIMLNLGKMKTMNKQSASTRPSLPAAGTNQKISLSQATKQGSGTLPPGNYGPPPKVAKQGTTQQPVRVGKPAAESKNKSKVLPRNNALPKPAGGTTGSAVSRVGQTATNKRTVQPVEDDMEVDSSPEEEDDDTDTPDDEDEETSTSSQSTPPPAPPAKKSAPPPSAKTKTVPTGGKAPPTKSLQANRINPMDSTKKGKGKPTPSNPPTTASSKSSPNGKAKPAAVSPTSSTTTNGTASSVVAKKSTPPSTVSSATAKNAKKKKKGPEDMYKKLKAYVPTMPGTDYEMPKLTSIGSYTNRQGQQVWVCLVCNEKEQEESSRDMICCEMCEDWYHFECVGIRQQMDEDDPWYCKRCIYQTCSNPKKDFPKLFKNDLLDM